MAGNVQPGQITQVQSGPSTGQQVLEYANAIAGLMGQIQEYKTNKARMEMAQSQQKAGNMALLLEYRELADDDKVLAMMGYKPNEYQSVRTTLDAIPLNHRQVMEKAFYDHSVSDVSNAQNTYGAALDAFKQATTFAGAGAAANVAQTTTPEEKPELPGYHIEGDVDYVFNDLVSQRTSLREQQKSPSVDDYTKQLLAKREKDLQAEINRINPFRETGKVVTVNLGNNYAAKQGYSTKENPTAGMPKFTAETVPIKNESERGVFKKLLGKIKTIDKKREEGTVTKAELEASGKATDILLSKVKEPPKDQVTFKPLKELMSDAEWVAAYKMLEGQPTGTWDQYLMSAKVGVPKPTLTTEELEQQFKHRKLLEEQFTKEIANLDEALKGYPMNKDSYYKSEAGKLRMARINVLSSQLYGIEFGRFIQESGADPATVQVWIEKASNFANEKIWNFGSGVRFETNALNNSGNNSSSSTLTEQKQTEYNKKTTLSKKGEDVQKEIFN